MVTYQIRPYPLYHFYLFLPQLTTLRHHHIIFRVSRQLPHLAPLFEETIAQRAQGFAGVESLGRYIFDKSFVGISERTRSIDWVSCWNMAKDLSFVGVSKWTGLDRLHQLGMSWQREEEEGRGGSRNPTMDGLVKRVWRMPSFWWYVWIGP